MKKLILFALIIIGFQTAKSQVYIQRYALANKDTVRTQIRMSAIEIAKSYIDTSTNGNKKLCSFILGEPTASYWVDWFAYPLAAIAPNATPTDAQVKAGMQNLWWTVVYLSTRR